MAHDPHSLLGLQNQDGKQIIRIFRPGSEWNDIEVFGKIVKTKREDDEGNFIYFPEKKVHAKDYRIYHRSGLLAHDPYAFLPTIGDTDFFLFNKGCHYELYNMLGAHFGTFHGLQGVRFAVWAPNAQDVSLIGDFNHWDGRVNPMRSMGVSGVWELFVPGLQLGEKYKYEIRTQEGYIRVKSDPLAFYSELRPNTASIVASINSYSWTDKAWMEKRKTLDLNRPIRIYEVHLGSWRRYGDSFPNYRKLAVELAQYVKEMHFTHVELLPVMEHPFDDSWGYQTTGFFATTSRYGTVEDFQYFIDYMHSQEIGVILDWVPAHFPTDDFALIRFDGTALYEHDDPRQGIHPHWNTAIFNYERKEVTNFLIASAIFWCEKMHADGLRVDAVASLLYLDYGRNDGEWIPNPDGSNFNIPAIEFVKHLNSIIHERTPGILMIAEESTSYGGVTLLTKDGGLGFDLKWNMGWMNDTLSYFSTDPIYRKYQQNDLTFGLLYAFAENFMLVLSHDEVVHCKNSLLFKMPGDDWQKFANVRLLHSYMLCHPGKNLLFMGGELGQWGEWDFQGQIDWFLLQYPLHAALHKMIRDLNGLSQDYKSFWERDFTWEGFQWIDFSDADRSIISFLRKSSGPTVVCVHNFTPEVYHDYGIKLANVKKIKEIFNTDAKDYGGSNVLNPSIRIEKEHFLMSVAPLATHIFEVEL